MNIDPVHVISFSFGILRWQAFYISLGLSIFFNVACLELPSVASGIMHAHVHANS